MHTQKKTHELTFDFERLVVYQRTLELITLVTPLLDNPPKRAAKPCEDFDRALQSIAFNIPEGCGRRRGSKDRKRFYDYALGSAKESASQVIFLHIRGHMKSQTYQEARSLLLEIVAMLTSMTR